MVVEIQPRNPLPLQHCRLRDWWTGLSSGFSALAFNKDKDKLFFYWNQEWYEQLAPEGHATSRCRHCSNGYGDFSQTTDGNNNVKVFIKDPLLSGHLQRHRSDCVLPRWRRVQQNPGEPVLQQRPGDSESLSAAERIRQSGVQLHLSRLDAVPAS